MLRRAQQRDPGDGVLRVLGEDAGDDEGEAWGQVDRAPDQHDLRDDRDHRDVQGVFQSRQDHRRHPDCDQANLRDQEKTRGRRGERG